MLVETTACQGWRVFLRHSVENLLNPWRSRKTPPPGLEINLQPHVTLTFDLLTFDLPTCDLPTFDLPTCDIPTCDLPTCDLLTSWPLTSWPQTWPFHVLRVVTDEWQRMNGRVETTTPPPRNTCSYRSKSKMQWIKMNMKQVQYMKNCIRSRYTHIDINKTEITCHFC